MKIVPTGSRLLVRIHDAGLNPDSNIVVPEGYAQLLPYGEVLAIGPEVNEYEVGDKVIFLPDQGIALPDNTMIINKGVIFAEYQPDAPVDGIKLLERN